MPAELQFVTIHGYRRAYRMAGQGPVILLIHGLGCDSSTWDPVFDALAENHTVIAPDLLGHGGSDKPRADYSPGGYANAMRDLLAVFNIERATVVGHSFGGGIAQQVLYQYPQLVERLILVDPGGLGPDVTPLIRFLTLPGSGVALAVVTSVPLRPVIWATMNALSKLPVPAFHDFDEVAKIYRTLGDPASRRAVQSLTRHALDWRGQAITALDRRYLGTHVPKLLIWGELDRVLPVTHARMVVPGEREQVVILEDAAHFPHRDEPDLFVDLIEEFIADNEPATFVRSRWQRALRTGPVPAVG